MSDPHTDGSLDREPRCAPNGAGGEAALPAILDLEHLRTFTRGDRALEAEVFDLFRDDLQVGLRTIADDIASDAPWRMGLHRLKGSALAIGAMCVAAAARAAEVIPPAELPARRAALATLHREAARLLPEIARAVSSPP